MDWIGKLTQLRSWFPDPQDTKGIFETLLKLGKKLPSPSSEDLKEEHLVKGCQSRLYLTFSVHPEHLSFSAFSEALISAGLAYVLVFMFSGEPAENIAKSKLDFLKELGIPEALTPSRSNGLYALHLKIRQYALQALMQK